MIWYTIYCSCFAGESLEGLLKCDREDALRHHFSSDHALFQQLYGLTSAIGSLHNYEDSTDQLRLKGCHFDLAPRNVLLWNKGFCLPTLVYYRCEMKIRTRVRHSKAVQVTMQRQNALEKTSDRSTNTVALAISSRLMQHLWY